MPDEHTYGFAKDDAESLVQLISRGEAAVPEIRPRGKGLRTSVAVILDAALPAATNSKLSPTSALARVLTWNAADNEYVESVDQITVWNHSESVSHGVDTFGKAELIDNHYWFFGDCDPMADREAT